MPLTERSRKGIEKVRWETKGMERKVDIVLQYDNFNVAFFLSTSNSLHGHLSPLSVSSSLCHYLQVNDPLCPYFLSDSTYFSLPKAICISLTLSLSLSPFLSLPFSFSLILHPFLPFPLLPQDSILPASRQLAIILLGATGYPKGNPLWSTIIPLIRTILIRGGNKHFFRCEEKNAKR